MRGLITSVTLSVLMSLGGMSLSVQQPGAEQRRVVIASKPFGESYILAEMFAQLMESRGIPVMLKPGLGSTEILIGALRQGAIDIYPEYTGTGLLAILHDTLSPTTLADTRRVYAHVDSAFQDRWGMRWLPPLGFQNTFTVAVRPSTAIKYRLRTLSDLAREGVHLRAGFTPDFIERRDGLAGLAMVYGPGIRPRTVTPLLPALKYRALVSGSVDVVDGFSTDGLLARYGLSVLTDDRHFFPPYEAAALLGARAAARGDVVAALTLLSGRLDEATMRSLNRRVEVDGEEARVVAASALRALGLVTASNEAASTSAESTTDRARGQSFVAYLWGRRVALGRLTLRHLWLVALALAVASLVAIPLGLALERARRVAEPILGGLGVLQTIPSIALLAFMVPLLGIGA
ncbi:MAG: glycine betaine ABC transporter substrate-binding protein, partial [Gemmatimonadaceae bacterium]